MHVQQNIKKSPFNATLKPLKTKIMYIIVYNNIISVTYYYIQ